MGKSRDEIYREVIKTLDVDIQNTEYFTEFDVLDIDNKLLAIKYINKAFDESAKDQMFLKEDILIPFVGKLKIKAVRQFALNHMDEVAKELGYINFYDIPRDKLDYANKKVKELTLQDKSIYKSEEAVLREERKQNRITKSKQIENDKNPIIFTFKMKKD
jgi:hypothetical protein